MSQLETVPWQLAEASRHIQTALMATIEAENNRAFQEVWRLARLLDETSGKLAAAADKPPKRNKPGMRRSPRKANVEMAGQAGGKC
jgi:hypothetical protein